MVQHDAGLRMCPRFQGGLKFLSRRRLDPCGEIAMRRKIQPLKFLSNEFLTNTSAVQTYIRTHTHTHGGVMCGLPVLTAVHRSIDRSTTHLSVFLSIYLFTWQETAAEPLGSRGSAAEQLPVPSKLLQGSSWLLWC